MWPFRRRHDEDFHREIEAHLALEIDRLIADGMSPGEARHAAMRAFGNIARTRERHYESRRVVWLDELGQDLGYAFRMYRRAPGFAAAVVLTLALGIGAVSAVFTLADHMLFRPLPYPESDRLVVLSARGFLNAADYLRARQYNTSLESIAEAGTVGLARLPDVQEEVLAYSVDEGFLDVLGARPAIGRAFVDADHDAPAVALITWSAYRSGFGGRADILEQDVMYGGQNPQRYRIVGVLAPDFVFPDNVNEAPSVLLPGRTDPARVGAPNSLSRPIARLKAGVSMEAAAAEMAAIARAVERDYPALRQGREVVITPLREALFGRIRTPLILLLVATGCLLLLACANLAHLLLARLQARQQEFGIRLAIGAGRLRLARQLAVEFVLLAVAGGALALVVAQSTLAGILARAPRTAHVYRLLSLDVDLRVVAFAAALAAVALIVAGVLPSFAASRTELNTRLLEGGTAASPRTRRHRILIAAQTGVTVSLLITSALVVHSFVRLVATPTGFHPSGVRTLTTDTPSDTAPSVRFALHRELYEHLRGRGQSSVAVTDGIPSLHLATVIAGPAPDASIAAYSTSATFADVMGLQIVRGRYFDEGEAFSNAPVVVIDEAAAARLWPGRDPLGQSLSTADGIAREVIGVVRSVRMQLTGDPNFAGTAFRPMDANATRTLLVVRGDLPADVLASVDGVAAAYTAGAATRLSAPVEVFERELGQPRFLATLLGALGVLTMCLAGVGIYGVISHLTAGRRHEMGIRLALGEQRQRIRRGVVRDALVPAAVGVALGLGPALWWTQRLRTVLHDVQPGDPGTVAAASLLVLFLVLVASLIPATRASRIDPLLALRSQ